jgi:hypothetical protein
MSKYFAAFGGGIGDAVLTYIDSEALRRLPHIKERNPNDEFHIFSQVHNDGINEMFYHHPAISKHVQVNMLPQAPYHGMPYDCIPPGYLPLNSYPNLDSYAKTDPVFNLSDGEKRLLDSIFDCAKGEPVIVISPFAGMPVRDAFNNRTLNLMVDMLPGHKIILGKNHLRGELPTDHRPEAFEYGGKDPQRVHNLIDKVGIRFTWHLLQRCSAFIGGHSSVILMAWEHNKPNVCAMSDFITIDGPNGLDRKYLRGRGRANTFMPVFKSEDFGTLDLHAVAGHIKAHI